MNTVEELEKQIIKLNVQLAIAKILLVEISDDLKDGTLDTFYDTSGNWYKETMKLVNEIK